MQGFEAGGVDYVTKPFNSSELLKRIETHITLRKVSKELKASNESYKELVHILCHDLGNPVYAVQGLLELGAEDKDFLLENIEIMRTAIFNATEIIEVIKKMRALEESKIIIKTEFLELKPLIEEGLKILDQKIKKKDLKINMNVPEDIQIKTEKTTFINSVLNNILSNAVKFSNKNSEINISAKKENKHVLFSIRDYGIGMPEKIRNNIFKINTATTRRGTDNEQGTGFGMPLVKKFIEIYEGSIEINSWEKGVSNEQSGTEVCITLKSEN